VPHGTEPSGNREDRGGTARSCASGGGEQSGQSSEREEGQERLRRRLAAIRHTVIVLSGKGGVGKTTVAVNLAAAATQAGLAVGLLDVDIHGPSVPTMLGIVGARVTAEEDGLAPVRLGRLKVMSIGFLLGGRNEAVIWRGPMKMKAIEQFLRDVAWGELDLLVVDAPPGTGDEPLSVCQLLGHPDGAVIVTTPQEVALAAVRRSITFCRRLELPVLGVVENMSGFVCPGCGLVTEVFGAGAGEAMAREMGVPFLGRIPMHPGISASCDAGAAISAGGDMPAVAEAFERVAAPLIALARNPATAQAQGVAMSGSHGTLLIAIPLDGSELASHFGHCASFSLVEADPGSRKIVGRHDVPAPEHQPGLLPRWLGERGVRVVIARDMGQRAKESLSELGIEVLVGAPSDAPEELARAWLAGTLTAGVNTCDH